MLHGFLNVDKPAGITSHDVVARLRRATAQKRVGHGGTLDPAATGVLPVALGEATRLLEFLVEGRKRYLATVHLGVVTTTDDAEGEVVAEHPVPALTSADLEVVLARFIGTIQQVPPMYSAIQVGGQRLYDLARRGTTIDLPPRPVEIEQVALLDWQAPLLTLDLICGKGTYVRALARDVGEALGCGAHLLKLRRTAVGPLGSETAQPLDALRSIDDIRRVLLPPDSAVAQLPRLDLDPEQAQRVRHGLPLELDAANAATVARAHADGVLLALLHWDGSRWRPQKVFGWRQQ